MLIGPKVSGPYGKTSKARHGLPGIIENRNSSITIEETVRSIIFVITRFFEGIHGVNELGQQWPFELIGVKYGQPEFLLGELQLIIRRFFVRESSCTLDA